VSIMFRTLSISMWWLGVHIIERWHGASTVWALQQCPSWPPYNLL
jgi:hypothetical protein